MQILNQKKYALDVSLQHIVENQNNNRESKILHKKGVFNKLEFNKSLDCIGMLINRYSQNQSRNEQADRVQEHVKEKICYVYGLHCSSIRRQYKASRRRFS